VDEVVWHVWGEAPEVLQKLGWLAVAHLERKELADALRSGGGQPPHQLCPQRGVGVSFRRRGRILQGTLAKYDENFRKWLEEKYYIPIAGRIYFH
jgi:hypothetical protein